MYDLQEVMSVLNFLGLGGVGLFVYFLVKGLRVRVQALTELANEQKKTLDAVRSRAEEMDKLSGAYKKALTDFQEMGEKLEQRRNNLVKELEDANQKKDAELARYTELKIEELELQKKSLKRIPELEKELSKIATDLNNQMKIVSPLTFTYEGIETERSFFPLSFFPSHNHVKVFKEGEEQKIFVAGSKWKDPESEEDTSEEDAKE